MSLDLAFDDGQQAISDSLAQFCREHCDDDTLRASAGELPRALWCALAGLGVLEAGLPGSEAGALEICAAMEALGRAAFPGPLAGSWLALRVLPGKEAEGVAAGRTIVSAGQPPLLPFAPVADVFLEIAGDQVHRAEALGAIEPVATLGGEPWGRLRLRRVERLPGAAAGLALSELALAAYLAAAGERLVADASQHARTRQQFGQSIGEFQAVAHPLAECHIRLAAARTLARAAAWRFDRVGPPAARPAAARARLSAAAAAVEAAHTAHQVFGAVGITLEGPVFHVSRRIRQLASQPPGDGPARRVVLDEMGLPATTG